ncbi:NADPH:quinone oxidoreductase family protein [Seohaeicola zhoushanensis]|uniref:NADPH:quinone oxidoreductase n=1 Tax=Seohaeicola zhoushanensis TaxID=1569283 RepID=A0A8J3MAG4_9RHOB|nr:NADPH:quinone oxidoreductase family protein [Seohaeicola zhoushanensis]GHF67143.1 NADPH:quinone oxidoreductase [Seohaeicola zhoushanensis]
MKAWVCREYRAPYVMAIEDMPVPLPGPGEVQIRVAAAGLAFGETLVLNGSYQKTPPLPYIPVSEMSGVITAVGDGVEHLSVGDRVSAFSFDLAGGGLAEYAVMPAQFVFAVPRGMTLVEAAAYPMNAWTAWNALGSRGRLQPGEVLVVHGATGGVGQAAVQIGKHLGATVIATGHDARRLATLTGSGPHHLIADHVIDLGTESLRDRVKALTGGRGADVFLDPVGGQVFDDSLRCIAPGGRVLVVGFTSGTPSAPRTNVMLVKMIAVIGVEARLAIETTGGRGREEFDRMLAAYADGRLKAQVGRTYGFEDALQGYDDILARRHVGKSVLIVNPELT